MGHGAHGARGAAGGRAGALDPRWCSITSSVSTSRAQSAASILPWIAPLPAMPRKSENDGSLTSQVLWHRHSTSCALGSDAARAGSDAASAASVIVLSMSCLSSDWHGEGGAR